MQVCTLAPRVPSGPLGARACADELEKRGIDEELLLVTYQSRTGHLKTAFFPRSREDLRRRREEELERKRQRAMSEVGKWMEEHGRCNVW